MSQVLESSWEMHNDYGTNDFTDRQGANKLKARIEQYWRERGFAVQVMLVDAPFSPAVRAARVDIRSDLVNGMPRRLPRTEPLRN